MKETFFFILEPVVKMMAPAVQYSAESHLGAFILCTSKEVGHLILWSHSEWAISVGI